MKDVIYRQDAIDSVQRIGRLATLTDNDAVIRMSAVEYVLYNLPSAQPDVLDTNVGDIISRQAAIDECNKRGAEHIGYAIAHLPSAQPEPCEDAVSRKAVYEAIIEKGQRSRRYRLGETWELNGAEIRETLDTVPPVTPKRKTGKWIKNYLYSGSNMVLSYTCSECGAKIPVKCSRNYCPNCGAKMNGGE